jgi:hypothetical protein
MLASVLMRQMWSDLAILSVGNFSLAKAQPLRVGMPFGSTWYAGAICLVDIEGDGQSCAADETHNRRMVHEHKILWSKFMSTRMLVLLGSRAAVLISTGMARIVVKPCSSCVPEGFYARPAFQTF